VLAADPLAVDPLTIMEIAVEMTVVGGKVVYARE
jgi:predicted amidohydrolase YtcJ